MKRMMINSKLIVVITAILLISCAFAQVGKTDSRGDGLIKDSLKSQEVAEKGKPSYNKNYENFQEKIEDYKKNFVYRSSIKDDLTKLNSEQKENHLAQYRKKLMNIMGKDEKTWDFEHEALLSQLYYHKVNLNKYKEIGDLIGFDLNKIFKGNGTLKPKEIGLKRLLKKIIYSDIILEGNVIDIRKVTPYEGEMSDEDGTYNWEVTISVNKILYKNSTFFDGIKDVVKVLLRDIEYSRMLKYKDNYENRRSSIYYFSKKFHDEMLNRKDKNNFRKDAIDKFKSNNIFPPSGEISIYDDKDNIKAYDIINKYGKINNPIEFFNREIK